jgi:hypothetical protein
MGRETGGRVAVALGGDFRGPGLVRAVIGPALGREELGLVCRLAGGQRRRGLAAMRVLPMRIGDLGLFGRALR